jgi:hypothetical protein
MPRLLVGLLLVGLALGALLAAPISNAQQAKPAAPPLKLALLIANQGYSRQVGPLANPHNDIGLMGAALKSIGFEVLAPVTEAKRAQMLAAVSAFTARLRAAGPGAVGFVYYSGHGAADADTGTNYLIPIDAPEPGSATFWYEALKLDDVLKELDRAKAAAKFVVFDACRNELAASDKSTTKGFVPVAEQAGMFIAYATAQGRTATDKGAKGGPYSNALSAEIVKPGLHHLDLFQNVKETVSAATSGVQVPWERNGLLLRQYLAGTPAAPGVPVAPPSQKTPEVMRSEVAAFCREVSTIPSIDVVESLLATYKGTPMVGCASARLNELKRQLPTPPTIAKLTLHVTPPTAIVFIDEKRVGPGPVIELTRQPGKMKIRVEAPGYQLSTKELAIAAGDSVNLHLDLASVVQMAPPPTTARLSLQVKPAGASVFIDGKLAGKESVIDVERKAGKVSIRVEAAKHHPESRDLELTAGEAVKLILALQPIPQADPPPVASSRPPERRSKSEEPPAEPPRRAAVLPPPPP